MSSILTRDGKFLRTTDGKGLNFDSLIAQANEKTGANDKTLGAAAQRLMDGYGGGGSVPTPTAADAGKVPVANDQGGYTLGEKADKPSIFTSGTSITLADNTIYNLTDVTNLDITFPASGSYHAHINLTTAASGPITITLPSGALFIGAKPSFSTGETWEIDVMDGKICVGKAVAGA